ncbi:recombinase family protein [Streptomyces sp. NPDC018352]|uniref:recombinase family protein n=1 Tax=Streptomyces sp. NPDC018352 TaxID=3157194 RepID=UPI0033E795DE
MPARVAIYLRVSTARQLKGYGLQVQFEECIAWLDYKIGKGKYSYEVYTDGGISGKLAKRPDLSALNADIEAGQYDLVVFGKLDRIGRTMKDIHRWVYDTTDQDVRVATADGRIDSDDEMFGIQLSLLAYMAELEHTMILDRTMGGREKKLEAGGWPGGVAPFWLELPGKGANTAPTLREGGVKLLDQAARLIADERNNAEEAAKRLSALGYTTPRGLPWTGANLIRVFMQTALDGYIIYRNTDHPRGNSVRLGSDGQPLYGETVRILVPKPLPAERIAQVRKALARRSFTKKSQKEYLLSTRVQALCGHHYVGTHREVRGRTTYRCSGRRDENPCTCQEILVEPLEDVVWKEVADTLGDKDKLKRLAEEWIGDIPNRSRSYRERIAEIEEQIERNQRMRKKKLVALAAAMAADESDDAETEEEIQATIEDVREELKGKERQLRKMRDDTMEWLLEAQQQESRAQEVLDLAHQARPRLDDLPVDKKRDLLELLDVRVLVTSSVPGALRNAGCPFEAWFQKYTRMVPPTLTDEQWASVEDLFPRPKKQSRIVPPRLAFEASLYKVRHGLMWKDLPEHVTQGQRPQSLYQRALEYLKTGAWERAVCVLGDYDGTPVPPLYGLPDLYITGTFDPRLGSPTKCDVTGGDTTTSEGAPAHVSNCSWRTRASSTATTARSCAPCNGPPTTAA